MARGVRHTRAEREAFQKARDAGETLASAARIAGIPEGTAARWDGSRRRGELVESEQSITIASLQDELAAVRKRLAKAEAMPEILASAIGSIVPPLQRERAVRPKVTPKKLLSAEPEVAFLCVSDAQAGQRVDPDDVMGLNAYGIEEFRRRARLLTEKTVSLLELERATRPIDELCVLFLGDLVEGDQIFPGQQFEVDCEVLQQVVSCMDEFAAMLTTFAAYMPQVSVYAVPGNHGRASKRGASTMNYDALLYTLLPRLLSEHENVWFAPAGPRMVAFEKPAGQRHVITHGDQVRAWMNIPFYGLDRAAQRLQNLTHLPLDCLWIGHHHSAVSIPGPTERVVNGSMVGSSKYSVEDLMVGDIPRQWLIGWGEHGRTWSYDIRLAEPRPLVADEHGMLRGDAA